ncbi:MAG: aminopeptidase P family N-terminal domain-containing protein, partial [Gemmatimonadota bacterium]|nr:aminopeptidase P family N-terminal domain-containing protein [Gemmatimonadota bacterium]
MISRRNFLGASAATLAGVTAAPTSIEAQAQQGREDLPPSILVLTSMKDQATPITLEERRQRIEKARRLMRANELDAILLIGGTSLVYYANVSWWNSERLFALILPVEGRPFVVTPAFEEDRVREQLDNGPLVEDDVDVLTWHEDDDPYRLVAQGLRELGRSTGRLGIEETVRFVFSDGVARAAPSLQLASATPVTAGCRGVKTAHELALMRLASAVTLKAYEAAWRGLKDGMTQQRFAELVSAAHDRLGFSGGAGVQVGEYSALPHGSSAPQVIREGTILLIDGG